MEDSKIFDFITGYKTVIYFQFTWYQAGNQVPVPFYMVLVLIIDTTSSTLIMQVDKFLKNFGYKLTNIPPTILN